MRQFRTVLKFEYLNYVKSKSFVVITAILSVVIVALCFFPQIQNGFQSIFGSDNMNDEEMINAAFYDSSDLYTSELLQTYTEGYKWTHLDSRENLAALVEDGTFDFAVTIDGLDIQIYQAGSDMMYSDISYVIAEVVKNVYQYSQISQAGLAEDEITAILTAEPTVSSISVGKDTSESFWISYIVLFLLYFALVYYGASIGGSVVTEKTSKAMELLVTSAKPMPLMFGKVLGVGFAGLTQLAIIMVAAFISLNLNSASIIDAYPIVGAMLQGSLSADVLICAVVFFLLGFFSYAFVYAALASTVSRPEDASSVTSIPTFLLVAAFMVAMMGLTSPDSMHLKVLSYVPFFSPMVMFMRISLLDIQTWQILISIGANVAYIIILGFISSRIYRVGIMLYGNKPKFRDILTYIKA